MLKIDPKKYIKKRTEKLRDVRKRYQNENFHIKRNCGKFFYLHLYFVYDKFMKLFGYDNGW